MPDRLEGYNETMSARRRVRGLEHNCGGLDTLERLRPAMRAVSAKGPLLHAVGGNNDGSTTDERTYTPLLSIFTISSPFSGSYAQPASKSALPALAAFGCTLSLLLSARVDMFTALACFVYFSPCVWFPCLDCFKLHIIIMVGGGY